MTTLSTDTLPPTDASTFTLTATDDRSGVAATYYALDDQTPVLYSGPFAFAGLTGDHVLSYWSVDGAGNIEAANQAQLTSPTGADLSANLSGPTEGATGQTLDYELTVTNSGPGTATNFQIGLVATTGDVSSATTVSSDGLSCGPACSVASLAAGASVRVTVHVVFSSSGDNAVQAGVYSGAQQGDPNHDNDLATAFVHVRPAAADLSVSAVGPAVAIIGQTFTVDVTVTNTGPDTVSGFELDGAFGATGDSVSYGSTTSCPSDACFPAPLASGASITVQMAFLVTAATEGDYYFGGRTKNGSPSDPNSANDIGVALVHVRPAAADLSVSAVGPAVAIIGQTFTVDVTVTNTGPDTVSGFELDGAFGATGDSVSYGSTTSCPSDACFPAPLASGASITVQMAFLVTAATEGDYYFGGRTKNGSPSDPNSANDIGVALVHVRPAAADLSVSAVGPAVAIIGQTFTVDVTVTNTGPDTVSGFELDGAFGATGDSVSYGSTTSCPSDACFPAPLASGASITVQMAFLVTAATEGDYYFGGRTKNGSPSDPNSANDIGVALVHVRPAAADLSVSAVGPAVAIIGQTFTVDVTVTNTGPDTVSGFELDGAFGATGDSVSYGSTTSCPSDACFPAPLASGASITVQMAFLVTAATEGDYYFGGRTKNGSPSDPNSANDIGVALVHVIPRGSAVGDLRVSLVGDPTGAVGRPVSLSGTVTNTGPDTLDNVVVGVKLPVDCGVGTACIVPKFDAASVIVSIGGNGCTGSDGGTTYTCQITSFTAGSTYELTVTYVPTSTGPLQTSVSAATASDETDPDLSNNSANFTTDVGPPAPSAPELAPGNDLGVSSTDNITKISDPTFDVFGLAGLLTQLFEGEAVIGSATADSTGVALIRPHVAFADGQHVVTSRQVASDGTFGAMSSATAVTIDTVAPVLVLGFAGTGLVSVVGGSGIAEQQIVQAAGAVTVTGVDGGSGVAVLEAAGVAGGSLGDVVSTSNPLSLDTSALPAGVFYATFTASDLAGNNSQTSMLLVVLPPAPAAPTLDSRDDSGFSSSDGVTKITNPRFTVAAWSFADQSNGRTDTIGSALWIDGAAAGASILLGTNQGSLQTAYSLADGSHQVSVYHGFFADSTLWLTPTSAPTTIVIDTVAPVLVLGFAGTGLVSVVGGSGIAEQQIVQAAGAVTVTGVDGGSGVAVLEAAGVAGGSLGDVVSTSNPLSLDTSALPAGVFYATFTASDLAGNNSQTSMLLVVLPPAPAAPTLDSRDDSGFSSSDGVTKITNPRFTVAAWSFADQSNGRTDTIGSALWIDGAAAGASILLGTNQGSLQTAYSLADGSHQVSVYHGFFADSTLWLTPTSAPTTIVIDTVAPVLVLGFAGTGLVSVVGGSGIAEQQIVQAAAAVTVTGVDGGSGVAVLEAAGVAGGSLGDVVSTSNPLSLDTSALPAGVFYATFTASDLAGNNSQTSMLLVVLPPAPAAPTLDSRDDSGFSSSDGVTKITNPRFTVAAWSFADQSNGRTDTIGSALWIDGAAAGASILLGTNQGSLQTAYSLADGSHQVSVYHGFFADSTLWLTPTSAPTTIVIDTVAPVLVLGFAGTGLVSVVGGSGIAEQQIVQQAGAVTVTGVDGGSGVAVLEAAGVAGGSLGDVVSTSNPLSLDTSALPAGVFYATFTASDLAGNNSQTSMLLVVLPPAPAAPTLDSRDDSGFSSSDGVTKITNPRFTVAAWSFADQSNGRTDTIGSALWIDGAAAGASILLGTNQGSLQTAYSLADGSHQVSVYHGFFADSTLWLTPTSAPTTIVIDTVAPVLVLGFAGTGLVSAVGGSGIAEQQIVQQAGAVTVTGVDGGSGVAVLEAAGVAGGSLGDVVSTSNPLSLDTSALPAGVFYATFTASDLAGNNSQTSMLLVVLPPAPAAPTLDSRDDSGFSSSDGVTKITNPRFTVAAWSFADQSNGRTDTIGSALWIDGAAAGASILLGTNQGSLQTAYSLADGSHQVSVYHGFFADSTLWLTPTSAPTTIVIDTVAPAAPVLDLPAAEDSGASSTDNVTNDAVWHFFASGPSETGFAHVEELSPNGRDAIQSWNATPTNACNCYYYPDNQGGLGADGRQGVWTYSATFEDLAGNLSPVSNTLAITFDSIAPAAPVLDLPAAEDSGASSTDNVTNDAVWHFFASGPSETGFAHVEELSPNGRDAIQSWNATPTNACNCYYYPDNQGGLGADGRQGVWTYSATFEDLAGNLSPVSNTLAITFDSIAPAAPVLDLPAAEDSGASSTDNVTNDAVWHFFASGPSETGFAHVEELSPNGRDAIQSWNATPTNACNCYYYPDNQGGLGADGRQGVWTYSATFEDLAGNLSPVSNTLAITFDSIAPAAPVLDLPAAEDSGASSTDNVTNDAVWHFFASGPSETGFAHVEELSPNGRDAIQSWNATPTNACNCYYYPDNQGGLGADGRQGVWTYSATFEDLAGNLSPVSNTLAITFDSIAPAAPVLDLPAAEDSGASSTDNVTNDAVWHFFASGPSETGFAHVEELSPNGRDAIQSWNATPTNACNCYYYPDNQGGLGADGRQGVWTYSATFEDLAGNLSPVSNTLAITFDSIAPLVAPSFTGGLLSQTGVSGLVQQRFDDGSAYTWSLNATDVGGSGVASLLTTIGTGGASTALASFWVSGAGDGAYYTVFSATDLAGNTGYAYRLMVRLTATPDSPDLLAADDSGASSTDNITNVNKPRFTLAAWSFADQSNGLFDAGNSGTQLLRDGGAQGDGYIAGLGGGDLQSYFTLADGSHTITAYRYALLDGVYSYTATSAPTTIVIDTVAPSITPPANVIVEATSASGATATYGSATVTDATATTTTYSKTSGTVFPIGTTTVTVTTRDAAGNTTTASFTVTVRDTTPPAVTITSPAAGQTYDVGQTFTFSYTATDAVGVTSQTATVDGTAITNGATVNTAGMTAGTHTLTVTARDAAGHVTIKTVTFTVRFSTITLVSIVNALTLPTGPKTALLAALAVAQAAINTHTRVGNIVATAALDAVIVLITVDRARGVISAANAAQLTALATALRNALP